MINLTHPEIAEITVESLPPASLEALKALRNDACETTASSTFKLQSQQKFLRRILSPDAPTRSMMLVHGTGTGKTCTAIQVAEEYILRPEFQDKTVMVVASAAVQDNFRTQLFDMSRVSIDTVAGTLESKQCTGRRYLEMLLRIEKEPKNWNNPEVRDKLERTADRIIDEFYDFMAYESFGNLINEKLGGTAKDMDLDWVHETFDNRLLIIDEAHNLKESKDKESIKGVTRAMETLVKTANGLVLVLLTATPMFDTFDEIVYYMNLFLWNDRKQDFKTALKPVDFFNPDATLKAGQPEENFRKWTQSYVSFVKGENPFTFPFRLPPPKAISANEMQTSFLGKPLTPPERFKYLDKYLVASSVAGIQKTTLAGSETSDDETRRSAILIPTIAVLPGNKSFGETFKLAGKQYAYAGEPFLTPETLSNHSAKFVSILKSIDAGKGVVFVYSNYVQMGSRLFSMALEEHGYQPAEGQPLLASTSYTGASKGKYALLSDTSEAEFNRLMDKVKSSTNREGEQIKVVVASVIASEGVDFRYVRQIHILDPWWNMSRIEQVLGRGLRTCSHQLLDFEDQNCSVYLHVARTDDGKECFDEYTYRTKVEQKAIKIAKVRKVLAESAMDCPLQNLVNTLPEDWKLLDVPQRASERRDLGNYKLSGMMAPTFSDSPEVTICRVETLPPAPEHKRPLSTYLDVRDEILTKLAKLFADKPIWDRTDLREALRPYTDDVVAFHLQQAVSSGFRFKDSFGRPSVLESRGDLYALSPLTGPNTTMVERTTQPPSRAPVPIPEVEAPPEPEPEPEPDTDVLETKRTEFEWPADAVTRFRPEILDSYLVDHVLTDTERRAYFKSRPAKALFVDRVNVPGTEIFVMGKDTFEPPEPPVGDDLTQYRAWNSALLAKFIANKDVLFASVKNNKLTISKMTETLARRREKAGKKFEPVVCGTGENDKETMLKFAKFIDAKGVGAPKIKGSKGAEKEMPGTDLCTYIELLCREEHNSFWLTPEELDVLYDGKAKKGEPPTNQDQFTEAFRK
jgi:superfamily II DNA or RNA helicase